MTIEDAAKATRKCHLSFFGRPLLGEWYIVERNYDSESCPGKRVLGPLETANKEAQAACDRLNLLAVLESIREPSKSMINAAIHEEAFVYSQMITDIWRTMIDAKIKEVNEKK